MKKTLIVLFTSLFILASCNSGETEDSNQEENQSANTESEEANNQETNDSEEQTAESLITSAVDQAEGTVSFSADTKIDLTQGEDTETYQNVLTIDENNEMKSAINNNGDILTHYLHEGQSYIYQGQSLEEAEGEVNIEDNTYESIVSKLTSYQDGELSTLEEGYAITININDLDSLENVLDINSDAFSGVEAVEGNLQLYFNTDQLYTGSEFEGKLTVDGEEADIVARSDYSNIGSVDQIEKPNALTEQ